MKRQRRLDLGAWLFAVSLGAWLFWAVPTETLEHAILAVLCALAISIPVGILFSALIRATEEIDNEPRGGVIPGSHRDRREKPRLVIRDGKPDPLVVSPAGEWAPRPNAVLVYRVPNRTEH